MIFSPEISVVLITSEVFLFFPYFLVLLCNGLVVAGCSSSGKTVDTSSVSTSCGKGVVTAISSVTASTSVIISGNSVATVFSPEISVVLISSEVFLFFPYFLVLLCNGLVVTGCSSSGKTVVTSSVSTS